MKQKQLSIFEETSLSHKGYVIFLRAKGVDIQEALESAELVAVDQENYRVRSWPLSGEDDEVVKAVMGTFTSAWISAEEHAFDEMLTELGLEC